MKCRMLPLLLSLFVAFSAIQACGPTGSSGEKSIVDASEKAMPDDQKNQPDNRKKQPDAASSKGLEVRALGNVKLASEGILNMGNSTVASIGVLTRAKDLVSFKNAGQKTIVLKKLVAADHAGKVTEEFQVCKFGSGTKVCLKYQLPTLSPGKSWDIYLQYLPLASGERSGSLTLDYEEDGKAKKFTLTLKTRGRMASDKLPANLMAKGQAIIHKLWGGYSRNHDEAPGPMVMDKQGNLYFAGSATGHIKSISGASRNVFIVKVKSDGKLGWAKVYHSKFHDVISSTGDNLHIGAADAMTIDDQDNLYIAIKAGHGASNRFITLIMKFSSDGNKIWTKYWFASKKRLKYGDVATPFSITWVKGHLFVTGAAQTEQGQGILVFAMKSDGSLKWSKLIIPEGKKKYAHRGHTIKVDTKGNLYVGGVNYSYGGGPFLAKLTGAMGAASGVKLAWAKTFSGMAKGSNFNSMDLDSSGNIFLSAEVRPAGGGFVIIKVSPDGKKAVRNFMGTGHNYVVRVIGDTVFSGGTAKIPGWSRKGDGVMVALSTKDLSFKWGGVYFTGKGPYQSCEHSILGITKKGSDLFVMGQVYTGTTNSHRYWGYWYDYPVKTKIGNASYGDTTKTTLFLDLKDAAWVDKSVPGFKNDGVFEDIPSGFNIEFQNARDKNHETNGLGNDGDIFVMKIPLK